MVFNPLTALGTYMSLYNDIYVYLFKNKLRKYIIIRLKSDIVHIKPL